ncbi:MAG: hypothetical protein JWN10_1554 [Solirubrobacterales bacterium]|nr:hypothetical protein [Solirubrobacterales bacterium]
MLAAVFAGDRRVWRATAIVAVPLVGLIAFYCLRPQDYYTGTNNVETYTYVNQTPIGQPVCIPGLEIPGGTGRIRLQLISLGGIRPVLKMALSLGRGRGTIRSVLAPLPVPANHISLADFPIPVLPSHPSERAASLCVTAKDVVNWGGTPLPRVPSSDPPTAGGRPLLGRIAVWYLPPAGARRSYLAQAGAILQRASLFRPGFVGSWLYVVILLVVLPGLALASVRCLAVATAAGAAQVDSRRLAASVFAIAALNFACWALITPPFQSPDEVDHFAYTQSLVERGEAPSRNPASPLGRWASAEALALDDMGFLTDHQVGDTRPPWSPHQQAFYRAQVAKLHPSPANGGGNESAATHGAIYYAALAPAYLLASSSPLDQLTLMRLTSALIGALTVLFAFLLARELAPGRPWLAVLAALLVAYEPMYGFISGSVNNDVGINAGAAGLELLLILLLRRGVTLRLGLLTGAVLIALPIVKGTGYSLYPVAVVALLATLWRHHRRADAAGWGALALSALAVRELSLRLAGVFRPSSGPVGTQAASPSGAVHEVFAHPLGYLAYLWELFLPRLSFMAPHFETPGIPGFTIFVERGWGAFGWYDVLFPHWVYVVILVAMLAAPVLGVIAVRLEWGFVRRNSLELGLIALMPIAVVAGFEAAFYTTGVRPLIAEFGRYAFPGIAPLAVLVAGSLHAFGRRWMVFAGAGLLTSMVFLSYASQLLTLTTFYT